MGFLLSILYLVTSYLTPPTLFGPLAAFHVELILAVLVFLVSLPELIRSFVLKTPQALGLGGLALAVFMSVLVGEHWLGGGVHGLLDFVPSAFAYFLVCLHCNSKNRLKVIVLMLLFVCLFVIVHGLIDMKTGIYESGPFQSNTPEEEHAAELQAWNMQHPYLFSMRNDSGEWFYRLRGLGIISDPNDFGQLVVCAIPLLFIFWRQKKLLQNTAFVLLPCCAVLYGAFLTHSRGTIVALVAVALVVARRRIGTIPAIVLAGGLFIAASALHVTGGREISASAGSDRTGLWGQGLQLLRNQPIFGVGFGHFADKSDVGLTAHNSIVVCAAELGLFGLFFWSLFLFPTLRDALAIASTDKVTEGKTIIPANRLYHQVSGKQEVIDKAEINYLGTLLVLSFTGFLVQGMFLSRAFVMTLFLLGGMVEVVYQMALQREMVAPRLGLWQALRYAGVLAILLVLGMYLVVRVLNLMH